MRVAIRYLTIGILEFWKIENIMIKIKWIHCDLIYLNKGLKCQWETLISYKRVVI